MAGYQDLVVWQKAMDVVVLVYELTAKFPKDEIFGLVSQMRRAAVSIASNIAEGQGRRMQNEFNHFLGIANGSKAELETQLQLCERIKYVVREDIELVLNLLDDIGRMIYGLQGKLR